LVEYIDQQGSGLDRVIYVATIRNDEVKDLPTVNDDSIMHAATLMLITFLVWS
jgi:hypothetical protein